MTNNVIWQHNGGLLSYVDLYTHCHNNHTEGTEERSLPNRSKMPPSPPPSKN